MKDEEKKMKYTVTFELRAEAKGTQNEVDFIPVLICREHELREILEMFAEHPEDCESTIVDVHIATDEEIAKYPHYYD